ncbi:GATA transcription factor 23-like [Macadamia integrifolia]|uniref:GATA transcription factor 23-like n=1 Tax=Macadamia integrifolia TaxID=60698 RepID=UPI001C4F64DD|nr:GATA transcription factor 23-like [Macadamia integrifolia]
MGSGLDSHHHHQYRPSHRKPSHGQEQDSDDLLLEVNPKPKLTLKGKKNPRVTSQGKTEDKDKESEMFNEQLVTASTPRICVNCKTSKTPLWRSGPHGPKSLCNACGIRYRKRRRREFEFHKMGKGISMKEKKKNGQVVDKERVPLLLQGKFAGKEEAEAALLLMALSCGLCIR